MARPPRRPTFEPHEHPGGIPYDAPPPTAAALPPPPPSRPDRDPLRAMAPALVGLAAIGVAAVAIWLPVREAQDEAVKHFPGTAYVDVKRGASPVWHDVRWRMTTFRQISWRTGGNFTPPPSNFVRFEIRLHARLLGPKAKLGVYDADEYLHGAISGATFLYSLRDPDGRAWKPGDVTTNSLQRHSYRPAKGLDLLIHVDVPAAEARKVTLCVAFTADVLNVTRTPARRETVLRFER